MVRGVDLRDLFTGGMSWRRLAVLLEHLPIESAFKTAVRDATDLSALPEPEDGVYGPTSQAEVLIARVGDLVQHGLWMFADPDTRPKQAPTPYFRFGERSNVHPISAEAAAYMEYVRENRRHPPDDWKPAIG